MPTLAQTRGIEPKTPQAQDFQPEEKRVIFASSLGTVFEWYDFYLYAILAPFFAGLFFPGGNDTAALLSAFATYAAGFLVRPFGALVFGRVGDIVGRKYTFLVTIICMGLSTIAVGFLPTYASIGWAAPVLLVILRLVQGLALGGEYGGAATYVAEHAAENRRGIDTAWIQTTATLGLLLSLLGGAVADSLAVQAGGGGAEQRREDGDGEQHRLSPSSGSRPRPGSSRDCGNRRPRWRARSPPRPRRR